MKIPRALALLITATIASPRATTAQDSPGLLSAEFVYESASFPQCHASTIEQTPAGLVCAWFGGTEEGHEDVAIWFARMRSGIWSKPVEVANGVQADGTRHPCWNPVLFQAADGPLLLFYKVGPSPSRWWGMLKTSKDHGGTWSEARRLPENILGPIKNKPVLLADGRLLCGSSSEHDGWRVHFEWTADLGKTWKRTGAVNDKTEFGAIQPTILRRGEGELRALCRSRQQRIVAVSSRDGGRTWSAMKRTALPNPNAGFDAVTLADGRHLLVYNHTTRSGPSPRGREMLNVAVSDDGETWKAALVLERQERSEFSYPAVIQTTDGRVHISYTWKRRRIKHAVVDPAELRLRDMPRGRWPGLK